MIHRTASPTPNTNSVLFCAWETNFTLRQTHLPIRWFVTNLPRSFFSIRVSNVEKEQRRNIKKKLVSNQHGSSDGHSQLGFMLSFKACHWRITMALNISRMIVFMYLLATLLRCLSKVTSLLLWCELQKYMLSIIGFLSGAN